MIEGQPLASVMISLLRGSSKGSKFRFPVAIVFPPFIPGVSALLQRMDAELNATGKDVQH